MAKLYFRYGAMNSGKSTQILQVANNYEERNMKVLIIKPRIDTKSDDKIESRLGIFRKVDILLDKNESVLEYKNMFKNINCIIVDEVQFLNRDQVEELYVITKEENIPVICYGIRADFKMQGFVGSTRLLEISDTIEELKTICKCGKKATINARKINGKFVFEGNKIEIDNQDKITYESVCGNCYIKFKTDK